MLEVHQRDQNAVCTATPMNGVREIGEADGWEKRATSLARGCSERLQSAAGLGDARRAGTVFAGGVSRRWKVRSDATALEGRQSSCSRLDPMHILSAFQDCAAVASDSGP